MPFVRDEAVSHVPGEVVVQTDDELRMVAPGVGRLTTKARRSPKSRSRSPLSFVLFVFFVAESVSLASLA